jgi:hypothetical protein
MGHVIKNGTDGEEDEWMIDPLSVRATRPLGDPTSVRNNAYARIKPQAHLDLPAAIEQLSKMADGTIILAAVVHMSRVVHPSILQTSSIGHPSSSISRLMITSGLFSFTSVASAPSLGSLASVLHIAHFTTSYHRRRAPPVP